MREKRINKHARAHYNTTVEYLVKAIDKAGNVNTTETYSYFVAFIGDVDRDGKVDASDLLDLSKAYGCELGDDNWDKRCDFNLDDKVEVSDLFDLSKNYGKTV